MISYIEGIIIFNNEGERRDILFKRGLNIITGESKSGKSALLDIIDYCLCSSQSTVPSGIISDFGYLYVTIFNFDGKRVFAGRHNWKLEGLNSNYMLLDNKTSFEDITLEYFKQHDTINNDSAIKELLRIFEVDVTDLSGPDDFRKVGRATIRSITPFIFQHQNLIASKFALFYRFDSTRQRQSTIREFPVFMGWVNQEYHSLLILEDELKIKVKRLEKELELSIANSDKSYDKLKSNIENYFTLIGKPIRDKLSKDSIIQVAKSLPEYNIEELDSDNILSDINMRYKRLLDLRNKKFEVEKRITDIENSDYQLNKYKNSLLSLNDKVIIEDLNLEPSVCPLCNNEIENATNQVQALIDSNKKLNDELKALEYKNDFFTEERFKLLRQKDDINEEIYSTESEVKELKSIEERIVDTEKLQDAVLYAKAQIETRLSFIEDEEYLSVKTRLDDAKKQLSSIKESIREYSLAKKYSDTSRILSDHINRIKRKLPFEDAFRDYNFVFDVKNEFDLFMETPTGKIRLGEMGSGANWLTIHLSVFLGLMNLNSSSSAIKIPSILFIDQPSQVYFPYDLTKLKDDSQADQDIDNVANIYTCILDEIFSIEENYGELPQVIVTDHIRKLDLEKYSYSDYVVAEWYDNKKLI